MIVEDYGCFPEISSNWVSLIITTLLPILLELIAGVYGCLSIRAFYNRSIILNSNRYIRLICFSVCDLLVGIPITLYYLYDTLVILTLEPFSGPTQEKFSQIFQLPAVVWRATTFSELNFELNRWIVIWGAFVFFAIFGFTEEARINYRAMLQYVVQYFVKITGIRVKSRPSSIKPEGCVTSFSFSVLCLIYSNILFRIIFYNSQAHGSSRGDVLPNS